MKINPLKTFQRDRKELQTHNTFLQTGKKKWFNILRKTKQKFTKEEQQQKQTGMCSLEQKSDDTNTSKVNKSPCSAYPTGEGQAA